MRNYQGRIASLRRKVFAAVAKLAYEGGDYHRIDKLPYELVPGEETSSGLLFVIAEISSTDRRALSRSRLRISSDASMGLLQSREIRMQPQRPSTGMQPHPPNSTAF